jgi:hypothetical protein
MLFNHFLIFVDNHFNSMVKMVSISSSLMKKVATVA